MLVQVWKNLLIAALIVICVSLALICNRLAHQNQADHIKEFQEQQVQIGGVTPAAGAFARLIAGPAPKRDPKQSMNEKQMARRGQVFSIEIEFIKPYSISRASMAFM
jgi:type IV secretory pathway VirB10-like protein